MTNLTTESFKIPAVGLYSFKGREINVFERLSAYGTGKKTVYSFTCEGVTKQHQDINQVKRFFGVDWAGSAKGPKAPKQAPKQTPEPEPKPAPAKPEKPAKSGIIRHHRYDFYKAQMMSGLCPYLYGPAGSGKNVIAQQLAEDLGLQFHYSNSVTQEYKITGFVDAQGRFHETEFYRALKYGGLFMFDEMDASCPDALLSINAALANGYLVFENQERVTVHPDFYCIAAGNTCGLGANEQYTGRQVLDAATLDRFVATPCDYSPDIEKVVAGGNLSILDFVRNLRTTADIIGLPLVLGYRCMIRLAKLTQIAATGVCTLREAVCCACLPGVDEDGIENIKANYKGARDNMFFAAL